MKNVFGPLTGGAKDGSWTSFLRGIRWAGLNFDYGKASPKHTGVPKFCFAQTHFLIKVIRDSDVPTQAQHFYNWGPRWFGGRILRYSRLKITPTPQKWPKSSKIENLGENSIGWGKDNKNMVLGVTFGVESDAALKSSQKWLQRPLSAIFSSGY